MKNRTILALLAALVLMSSSAFAQKYTSNISIDPLDLLVGKKLNLTYEHRLSAENSFTIFGSYIKWSDNWSATGIGGSYRWYLDAFKEGKTALNGLSVGPLAAVTFWTWDGGGVLSYDGGTTFLVGGEVAYKWIFKNQFSVEPIMRVAFPLGELDGLSYSGFGFGVNLGYSW